MSGSGVFDPALAAIASAAAGTGPVIAAVDGRCGSGKSTLARLAAERFGCPVAHMDEFYLPFARRAPDWRRVPCANMDLERFRREVLEPFRAGQSVRYTPYRCGEDRFGRTEVFPAGGLLLVEGSYCLHPDLAAYYDLKIFLTCSPETQTARLQAREGERLRNFQETWIPLEEAYFARYGVGRDALRIDTG